MSLLALQRARSPVNQTQPHRLSPVEDPLARRIGLINHGVHPFAGQPLPGRSAVRDGAVAGDCLAAAAQSALADGRANAHVLRHGRGHASRAASLAAVPRSLAAALSPSLAGWMLGAATFAWPLLLAGALKIAYDLALLARFRHIRPPEEQQQ
jgi:hypothetical protein